MASQEPDLILQDGYWFPAYDAPGTESLLKYLQKMVKDTVNSAAIARRHRCCLQAGGHIGIWPLALSWMFEKVVTCEAQPAAFAALQRNIERAHNVTSHNVALSDRLGAAKMLPSECSGTWRIDPAGTVPVRTITIDSLGLEFCDVIYLDIEGNEVAALKGAKETIARCRPILHLEVLPRCEQAIRAITEELRYTFVRSVHRDWIYVPR